MKNEPDIPPEDQLEAPYYYIVLRYDCDDGTLSVDLGDLEPFWAFALLTVALEELTENLPDVTVKWANEE